MWAVSFIRLVHKIRVVAQSLDLYVYLDHCILKPADCNIA